MSGPAIVPQMSHLDWSDPPWCERTQDMSGFVMPDSTTTSPLLDEQLSFTFSIAQNEIDFDIQHPDQSQRDFISEDQSEAVLGEDSIMFDNMNYSLHTEIDELQDTPSTNIEKKTKLTNTNDIVHLIPMANEEHLFTLTSPKVDIKALPAKKSGYLSIFDHEEPLIKEDPEFSSCSEIKEMFDESGEMDVAEEVVATAYEDHCNTPFKFDESPFPLESVLINPFADFKEEVVYANQTIVKQETSSDSKFACGINDVEFDIDYDDDLMLANTSSFTSSSIRHSKLQLDIEAAITSSNQLLGEGLPDTPEVLKPVLKPGSGFDLVSFLLANGDSNNNKTNHTLAERPTATTQQERRLGKSNLQSSNLKAPEKKPNNDTSPSTTNEVLEPTPGPSSTNSVTRRPARKSAMKLKKLMEEGFLELSPHSSDDEEYLTPKTKRRRQSESSSTSSRRRLTSESDHSIICEDGAKYRERRDRNNLSSKISRQKRKMKMEQSKVELKELEAKNSRLQKRANELSALLKKVHTAWQEYLVNMNKET